MKIKILNISLAIIFLGASLSSCKKDNSSALKSSTSGPAQLSLGINADNSTTALAASGNASFTFTSAIANVSEFRFEAKKNGLEIEVRSNSLTNINLLALNQSFAGFMLDTGTYKEIEVRAEFTKTSTSALPLVLKGNFTNSAGTVTPFEFDFNDNAEIRAEASNVVVDSKTDLSMLITLHLNKLLVNVAASDLSLATLTNGTLLISSNVNTAIYNKIVSTLQNAADADGFERHDRKDRGHDGGDNNNGDN